MFLYETYLYHIVRKDIRHNFSPYFYMLYLTAGDDTSFLVKSLTFCPQLLLLVAIAVRFHGDLPFSCFLCTFTFVMLNKVCTSQVRDVLSVSQFSSLKMITLVETKSKLVHLFDSFVMLVHVCECVTLSMCNQVCLCAAENYPPTL